MSFDFWKLGKSTDINYEDKINNPSITGNNDIEDDLSLFFGQTSDVEDNEGFYGEERLKEQNVEESQAEFYYDTHAVEPLTGDEKIYKSRFEETNDDNFDINNLNPEEWNDIQPIEDKTFGLFKNGNYTFKTSSGIEITLEDIKDVKILENKTTGEVIVVGANGAKITGGSENSILSIYDSNIDEINMGKGSDNIKINNSNVNEINTGKGTDSIVIQGNDSKVSKINTGAGSDNVSIMGINVENLNTSSKFLWGLFDSAEDTVFIDSSSIGNLKTGKGNDNVIVTDSSIQTMKTGKGEDNLSLNGTYTPKLKTDDNDVVVEDGNFVNIDIETISNIDALENVTLPDGSNLLLDDYIDSLLNQPTNFTTEEEYQEYVLQALTSNLETIKSTFSTQNDKDGWVASGYDELKELTGLGISEEDVQSMIAEHEAMIEGLTAAMNGQSDMTFEEAYKFYTGTSYSKEKIDKYLETSNVYSAMMVGLQYDPDYLEKFETATGKTVEDVTKEYAMCQLDTFGRSTGIQDLVEKYSTDQEGFADKLSSAVTSLGFGCTIAGAVLSFVFPPAGMALLTAGKTVTLCGMFVDNAIDLVDDTTDKDGLTKEELKENALETGVEAVSYLSGRLIGGGLKGIKLSGINETGALSKFINSGTNGLNDLVTSKILGNGISEVAAKVIGQAAETSTDMLLSLGADYLITQGESFISTGEFVAWDDYWSLDRFLGEGKSQLIGILTGISSTKVSAYQQGVMATAGEKINAGDIDGAKTYLKNSGMKMNDTNFEQFVKTVQDANVEIVPKQPLTTENENTEPPISKGGSDETELPKTIETETNTKTSEIEPQNESGSEINANKTVETDAQKPVDNDVLERQTPKIEIPERTSKYQDLSIEEKQQLVKNTIQDPNLANKFSSYSDEKITQVLDLKDMGLDEREILWSVNKNLNQQQFNTLTHLLESGYSKSSALDLATVDPIKLDNAIELTNKGLKTNLLDKVLNLDSSEYKKATQLLDLGIQDKAILEYVKLEPESYSKVIDILDTGFKDANGHYEIKRRLNLSNAEFEAEIQKLKQIEAMRENSNLPAEIKQIELSGDEIQELVTYLNKHGKTCSVDDSIEDLAWEWEKLYRTSGYTPDVLNPKIEDAMLMTNKRYTMPDKNGFANVMGSRINLSSTSLNRWMRISDIDSYIKNLPNVGETYSPNRIQSFSTGKHYAELGTTGYSDFAKENNVKVVVLPANKTTSAFQIENKKDAGCEVVYPSTTQFKVLYKGYEDYPLDSSCDPAKGSHQMYTVYLQEVIPDDVSQKFADTEIQDIATNQQLSSNAVALNQTFKAHIGEVKSETKERFSGLETVKDENITARAKGDDSTFSKLASKFKNGKLNSTDIDACSNAIGDAYGTRIQMNSVDSTVAETEITKALDGTGITYEQFVNHVANIVYDSETKQYVNHTTGEAVDQVTAAKVAKIKTPVLDTLKTAQSQEVVNRITSLIENADPNEPPVITELNNYGGTISSYFTDAQLEQIAGAYQTKYGKPLDIVTKLDETNHPSGKLEVTKKDGKKILSIESSKAKYTDKGAKKDSGYTSSQMNTKHKLSDGTVGNGELQIRGTEVNAFADVEHIPYDIRQDKIKADDPKYASVYRLIKGMDNTTYNKYNEYLTAVYDTLRLKELGIPVDKEPDIRTYLKNSGLSDANLKLLSKAGLEKFH